MKDKKTIWRSDFEVEDLKEGFDEDFLAGLDDDALYEECQRLNDEYLGDERLNLDIRLGRPIVVIADLGFWDGRRMGCKLIKSGNISDCLSESGVDSMEWYVDGLGDLRCDEHHHDGSNYLLYRVFKEGISEEKIENFLAKIYHGTVTRRDITRCTERLGDFIGDVYGWKFPRRKKTA